jgi:hypothetical protein
MSWAEGKRLDAMSERAWSWETMKCQEMSQEASHAA